MWLCICSVHVWKLESNFMGLIPSFYLLNVGSEDGAQVIKLAQQALLPVIHVDFSYIHFFF